MSHNDEPAEGLSRRELISRLVGAGCTACLGALVSSCPGGSDWGKPVKHGVGALQGGRVEVPTAEVPLNSVKAISLMGDAAFLVHFEQDGVEKWLALENKCTHKKSKLEFNSEGHFFKCPLHKSEFAMDGSVLERPGPKDWPAKRPLMSWPVTIEGSLAVIELDASQAAAAAAMAAEPRAKKDDDDDHGGRRRDGAGEGGEAGEASGGDNDADDHGGADDHDSDD